MSPTYFTADGRFAHTGVLSARMSHPRPFATIAEHDETLIACWNAVVRRDDIVWHLGDFAHKGTAEHAARVFRRLNGRKFLVRGNHDELSEGLQWEGSIRDVARVQVQGPGMREVHGIWLSHYAHRVWPNSNRGDLHLYGHFHACLPGTRASLDVGVDAWDWMPVTLDGILTRLAESATPSESGR